MANHAHIIDWKKPVTQEVLLEAANEFCRRTGGAFTVISNPKENWNALKIVGKYEDELCLEFWLGKHYVAVDRNKPDGKHKSVPSIEVRHGHSSNFMWFVDFKFTHFIADRFNAVFEDDCDGIITNPNTSKHTTYAKHASRMMQHAKSDADAGLIQKAAMRMFVKAQGMMAKKEIAFLLNVEPKLKKLLGDALELRR